MTVRRCSTCHFQYRDLKHEPCSSCVSFSLWQEPEKMNMDKTIIGVKFDNDKPQWTLVPFKAMTEVVDVLTYGAKKYAPDNWKKVPDARRRYIDAGFRHFIAYASGEKLDPETGKSHLAHAMCCMLFLLAFDKGEHHDQSDNDN